MVQIVQLGVVIFNTGLKPKSIWVQKDWLERWWSILYIYAIFPKVPNFFDKVFSKSTHPPCSGSKTRSLAPTAKDCV